MRGRADGFPVGGWCWELSTWFSLPVEEWTGRHGTVFEQERFPLVTRRGTLRPSVSALNIRCALLVLRPRVCLVHVSQGSGTENVFRKYY